MMKELGLKPMRRGPFSIDDLVLSGLGRVLEWEMSDGIVVRAGPDTRMTWSPEHKALVLLEGLKWERPTERAWDEVESRTDGRAARRKFEAWADRQAKLARAVKFSTKKQATWKRASLYATRLDYSSDKWGSRAQYTHDFGRGVRLYLYQASTRGPAIWVLKGGRMTVTERGIVN